MNKMLKAASVASDGIRNNQNNSDLKADVQKLVNIANMLADEFKGFIAEVHVSPMNIIQLKTEEVKSLDLFIIMNMYYEGDMQEAKQSCTDFIKVMLSDEFDGIQSVGSIKYSICNDCKEPTLLLYTVFNGDTVEELPDDAYTMFHEFTKVNDCAVTLPKSYAYARLKSIYIHAKSFTDSLVKKREFDNCVEAYGLKANSIEAVDKHTNIAYVILSDIRELPYDIPYLYLTEHSFNQQRLESLLKSKEME